MIETNDVEKPANGPTREFAKGLSSIRLTGIWGIAAAFAVLLGIFGINGWYSNESSKASQWVSHTFEVEGTLQKMLSVLQDTETGQRGYLLTGKESYLEPFVKAKGQIDDLVTKLHTLTADNPRQQQAIGRIKPLITEKLDELNLTITLRQADKHDEAIAIVNSDRGKLIMDRIRSLIADMEAEEERLLKSRKRELDRLETLSLYGEGIGIVLLIAIAGVVVYRIRHSLTLRQRAEEELGITEERTRLILGAAGQGIYGIDMTGIATFANPKACELLGYAAEELIGQPLHDLIHHSYPDGSPYPVENCLMYAAFKDSKVHVVDDEVL